MAKKTISLPIKDINSFDNLEDKMFIEIMNAKLDDPKVKKALHDKWVNTILKHGVITHKK